MSSIKSEPYVHGKYVRPFKYYYILWYKSGMKSSNAHGYSYLFLFKGCLLRSDLPFICIPLISNHYPAFFTNLYHLESIPLTHHSIPCSKCIRFCIHMNQSTNLLVLLSHVKCRVKKVSPSQGQESYNSMIGYN